jgi:hypothetical protein
LCIYVLFSLIANFRIGETMSNSDSLHERGSALENQFFADLDAKLLAELKTKQEHDNAVAEFSRISGIKDTAVLESIYKLGVTPSSFTALRVFPLAAVAWADGTLDDAERTTVSAIASTHFGSQGSPASQVLERWLKTKPGSELFAAWETYAKALVGTLSVSDAAALKSAIVNEIHAVASSSGGLLGWASVSSGENQALSRIEAALTRA